MTDFQTKYSLDHRRKESAKILERYQSRKPIIVHIAPDMILDKYKYLVPDDLTISQFICVLRKRINLAPEKAIFVFINNILPPSSATIISIYNTYKNDDGFLYFSIRGENVFG
jgi:GABA(A) receptor-associated protein